MGHKRNIKAINEYSYRLYRYQHVEVKLLSLSASSELTEIKTFTSINLAQILGYNPGAKACMCDIHWLAFMV